MKYFKHFLKTNDSARKTYWGALFTARTEVEKLIFHAQWYERAIEWLS